MNIVHDSTASEFDISLDQGDEAVDLGNTGLVARVAPACVGTIGTVGTMACIGTTTGTVGCIGTVACIGTIACGTAEGASA